MENLRIPAGGRAEIQTINGVSYLVARLDESTTCSEYLSELKAGRPVVVPFSRRGRLTGLLKENSVCTRQTTLVAGKWISFVPCEQRAFKS